MKPRSAKANGKRESGTALLIAIFALLLISVVGLALVVSTGTDSALAGNYRNSTNAYYAAMAGAEEARGRLLVKSPDYLNKTNVYNTLFSPQGVPTFGLTDVLYIINPSGAEAVDPQNLASPYGDNEYQTEMGWALTGANVHAYASSISPTLPVPVAAYKWIRINPVTEKSLSIDINNSGGGSGSYNSFTPLFYDGNGLNLMNRGNQALAVTAMSVMPDKSKKILQYIVAPNVITSVSSSPGNQDFPAAVTLAGTGVTLTGPGGSDTFPINGEDQSPACSSANYMVASVGYTNAGDSGIAAGAIPVGDYKGSPAMGSNPSPAPASVQNVSASMNSNWLNPAWLDEYVVQNITQNADVVINGDATGADISARAPTMNAANPMTIVVNGNLDLNSWYGQGYGLLLVTGVLNYSPTATWRGLVLVIGQGSFVSTASDSTGEIDGAVFIAKTRDPSNVLLTSLGPSSYSVTGSGSSARGITYNSCWIHGSGGVPGAQGPLNYRILAFREITQNTP